MIAGLRALRADERGAVAVETAIMAPVLVLMSLGSFQISMIIARQAELQNAVFEASSIALASPPVTETQRATLKSIVMTSTKLPSDKVTVASTYRCGQQSTMKTGSPDCGGDKTSIYVKLELRDTYRPVWSKYGLGNALNFKVNRYVLVKQNT